ncbi:MAG: HAMP domain-containing histidine kinase [Gemmatimonadetes bacterium]|nr:HAMP domain-containing histidine kinase [Gemmatimonadota bacterium]
MRHADSQELLAASIARAVQHDLAVPQSTSDIAHAVEAALLREARESERTLAGGRVVILALYTIFAAVAWADPAIVGLSALPIGNAVVGLIWLCAAVALMVPLRRGFYHRHLRRLVPTADAVGTFIITLLLQRSLAPGEALPAGAVMVAVTACALIAFSGSLRLSRTAARFTTAIAVLASLAIAATAGIPVIAAAFIAAAVLVIGLLSNRLTRVIRRVITNEIARVQLARMYDDARDAADAREEVLKIVSHDLRNPLSTIGMAAEMILETGDETAQARSVTIIRRTTDRMNRMVQDLLDVAKLETGRLAIEVEDTAVAVLVEEAVETLAPLAAEKGLTLTTVLDPNLPGICVDRGRILQVFSNLVGNAIKFTPGGGQITLYARPEADGVRFAVIDTGGGIPPDQLQRIFGRFWQAKASDRRGLGLGLTIAKSIVEAHGGRIGVESRPGEGAEFWFTVPATAG